MSDQLDIFTAVPEINEAGVYDECFAEVLSDKTERGKRLSIGWEIRVVRFPDGLWRGAPGFMGQTSGFSWPLSIQINGRENREQALADAAQIVHDFMQREVHTPLTRRTVAAMLKLGAKKGITHG